MATTEVTEVRCVLAAALTLVTTRLSCSPDQFDSLINSRLNLRFFLERVVHRQMKKRLTTQTGAAFGFTHGRDGQVLGGGILGDARKGPGLSMSTGNKRGRARVAKLPVETHVECLAILLCL